MAVTCSSFSGGELTPDDNHCEMSFSAIGRPEHEAHRYQYGGAQGWWSTTYSADFLSHLRIWRAISADGKVIAYDTGHAFASWDTNRADDLYLWDREVSAVAQPDAQIRGSQGDFLGDDVYTDLRIRRADVPHSRSMPGRPPPLPSACRMTAPWRIPSW